MAVFSLKVKLAMVAEKKNHIYKYTKSRKINIKHCMFFSSTSSVIIIISECLLGLYLLHTYRHFSPNELQSVTHLMLNGLVLVVAVLGFQRFGH